MAQEQLVKVTEAEVPQQIDAQVAVVELRL